MNQSHSILRSSPEKSPADSSQLFHHTFFALFLISFVAVWLEEMNIFTRSRDAGWAVAFLVATTLMTTLVSLARQLPAQNVLLASAIIAAIAGTVQAIGALSGIPFGPYFYSETSGPKFFEVLPWCIPALWVVILLNARGVARLVLRPWRKSRLYGFRLIGITVALTLAFDLGLEPYATQVKHFWLWQPTKLPLLWHGTPPSNFLGWLVTASVILAFVTPVLINKSHQKFPSDYHPLIVWILLSLLFATGLVIHQLWLAAGLTILTGLTVAVFAIRGARW